MIGLVSLSRASQPRYISITLYFAIALLFLGILIARSVGNASKEWRRFRPGLGLVLAGVFFGLQGGFWIYGAEMMRYFEIARRQGQAGLIFINHWLPERIHSD